MDKCKVFGIGFHKTGTTSLGTIFTRLGYRVGDYSHFRHLSDRENLELQELETFALQIAKDVDATKDSPWPLFYKALDTAYPGSKFIHITRNDDAWIKSAVNDFGEHPNAIRRAIYGSSFPKGNETAWLERYRSHNREGAEYLADRPDDYLHICLEEGVSYEKVCPFLGEPLVERGVPKTNTKFRKRLKMMWWRFFGLKRT